MEQQEQFSLGRIIIFGHQVEALKAFYLDHFYFSVTEEIKDFWVVLKAGSTELAIHKIGREYAPAAGKAFRVESNTKLVFQTRDDLNSIRKRLLDQGVVIGAIKSVEGMNSLFCDGEDTEGNVFQIEQRID